MEITSQEVVDIFQRSCDEYGKLFVPDPRQEGIIDNLIKFYRRHHDIEMLIESIDLFIRTNKEVAILVFDFALVAGKLAEKVEESRQDREEIRKLMEETKKRMEGYK